MDTSQLPNSSTNISLPEGFLWTQMTARPVHITTPKGKESIFPLELRLSNDQQKLLHKYPPYYLLPKCVNFEICAPYWLLELFCGMKPQFPILIKCLIITLEELPSLPCLIPHGLLLFLKITSQVDYLHLNLCLTFCWVGACGPYQKIKARKWCFKRNWIPKDI